MAEQSVITLSRELRFALSGNELSGLQSNNFAGNPPMRGLAAFCTVRACVAGAVDPATGMLMNIRDMDRILRQTAAPALRDFYLRTPAESPHSRNPAQVDAMPVAPLQKAAAEIRPLIAPHRLAGITAALSPFHALDLDFTRETPMIRMTQRFEFSAAHRLHTDTLTAAQNAALFGKCNNPNGHGHNYELDVTIGGPVAPDTGRLIPVHEFQQVVNQRVIQAFDHKHLNLDCPAFAGINPTVENIARIIFDLLHPAFPAPAKLLAVKVWETPKTWCEVTGEP